jgi:hypothetical protein
MAGWEPITPDITDEELQRRANSKEKRYTFIAHLQTLEKK